MPKKLFAAVSLAVLLSAAAPVRAQSTAPMTGMPGMKDSAAHKPKVVAAKKKTKQKAPVTRARRPTMSHDSMAGMPPMTKHPDSAMKMTVPDSTHARDSSMSASPMTMPMPMPDQAPMTHGGMAMPMRDSSPMQGMKPMTADDMMIGPLGVSMERMGSGTTWIPDAVTMPSRRTMMGSWMIMAHGFAFAQYDHQGGARGGDQFGSLNWAMLMATKNVAGGRFQARTMLSLDALTVTSKGYPLLLQTGESFNGKPLHDRQHPHDFFMELGALYQRQFTPALGWSIYAAPSGEPALGPVAFMHRPSAMDNPTAPISHHWQDATHVSFGVLTGGLFTKRIQLEASAFNGREPDQNRWDFDPIKIDSYSSRVTVNPSAAWSISAGYGYLKSPEASNPGMSMHRLTASVLNGRRIGTDGQVASALIWGANKHSEEPNLSHSLLAESEAILDRSNTFFGRAEWVQKSAEDLVVETGAPGLPAVLAGGFPATEIFDVSTAELGYIRELARARWSTIGLGAAVTLNFVPSRLTSVYGSRTPVGVFVFLRLRPFRERTPATTDTNGHQHE